MVQRFKVGERVRLGAACWEVPVGTRGTVAYVFLAVDAYTVVFDHDPAPRFVRASLLKPIARAAPVSQAA